MTRRLNRFVWDISEDKQNGDYFDVVRYTIDQALEKIEQLQEIVKELNEVNELIKKSGGYAAVFEALE